MMVAESKQEKRVTCTEKNKLIATICEEGIRVWCMYHKRSELISRESCLEVWQQQGNSQLSTCPDDQLSVG